MTSAAGDAPAAPWPGAAELADDVATLGARFGALAGAPPDGSLVGDITRFAARFLGALEAGDIRAAEPDPAATGSWRVNRWVKQGILLCFRVPGFRDWRDPIFAARDRTAFGLLDLLDSPGAREASAAGAPWRVVPGGSTVRSGAHLEPGVTIMPPAYINVGAWVGRGTMVDSHALVGSCAQVGRKVHLSAAAQVGGVLEPVGARPVIVEDDAFVGGGSGLYDGVVIGRGAVLAAGVILTGTSRLVDLVNETEHVGTPESPLVVPPGSVVVPGSRPASGEFARRMGIALSNPVVVKHRDLSTDARVALEEALR
jgi:2,3,4,5-tetrahydropyridine-2-carboxylate N-succinyltransferase